MGVSGLWASIAVALLAVAYLVVSGAGVASANEPDDPIDLGFPRNLAQQTYLEPALFSDGATKYPSDGTDYEVSYDLNGTPYEGTYDQPLAGRGPHGWYDTATFKCQTCHSPHAAQMPAADAEPGDLGGSKLLRAGSTGCEYCHVGSSIASSKRVYQATDDPYDLGKDSPEQPNSGHQLGLKASVPNSTLTEFTLSCGSCHSVHGATNDLWYPSDFFQPSDETTIADSTAAVGYKLLKADPAGLGTPAATFAELASSPATDPAAVSQFAYSAWCVTCHNDNASRVGYLGLTESFETTTFTLDLSEGMGPHGAHYAIDYPGPHETPIEGLYTGPSQCFDCHRGGLDPIPVGLDSTDTTEGALLDRIEATGAGYLVDADLDEGTLACSRCHYGTADFAADANRRAGTADWPHSSANDYALLGNWTLAPAMSAEDMTLIPDAGVTASTWPTLVCGRCHITDDGETFTTSWHVVQHNDLSVISSISDETMGLFGTRYSPGVQLP